MGRNFSRSPKFFYFIHYIYTSNLFKWLKSSFAWSGQTLLKKTLFSLGAFSSSVEPGFGHSKLLLLCFVQIGRTKLNSEQIFFFLITHYS